MGAAGILLFIVAAVAGTAVVVAQQKGGALDRSIYIERQFKSGYYFYTRKKYPAAINFFDRVLTADPHHHLSRIWLGQSYYMAGFVKNALTEWQVALNLGAGGNLLRSKINSLYHMQGNEKKLSYKTPYIFLKQVKGFRNKKGYFVRPTGVAVDKNNNMVIAGFQSGTLAFLDPNGKLKTVIDSGLKRPYDIALAPDGSFIVSDFGADIILRFNSNGDQLASFGGFGYTDGKLSGPEGVWCNPDGTIFVVDSGNSRIQKFSKDGKFLMKFGSKGRDDGEFFRPADVAAAADGRLFVSDTGNKRIQVFDPSGNWLQTIGTNLLRDPRGLTFLDKHRLAVADGEGGVVVYNRRDGSWNRIESLPGKVRRAVGLCKDSNNLLYITDFDDFNVNLFIPERLKYVNLDIRINRTLQHDFPAVQHYVTVRDRNGEPIIGLNRDNFRIYERGNLVPDLTLTPVWRHPKRIAAVFLVDKSLKMKPHQESMQRVMRGMLEKFGGRDKVQVITFGDDVFIAQKFISNVLSPLNGAKKGKFSSRSSLGRAFYLAVTELFQYSYRPAVVLFTAADFSDSSYNPYGFTTCMNYARNNDVPVYTVLFEQGKDKTRLEQLSKQTGGLTFDALTSNSVTDLREIILKRPTARYALYYRSSAANRERGHYREFSVELKYRGLFGYDKFGYYIP